MSEPIGELFLDNNKSLLKMWSIFVDLKSRPFERHSHTRFEITVVNSGSGEYTTENAVYPMLPGDVFVFSSNEVHCITKTGKDGLNITNLHFEPRYLIDDLSASYINFCFFHSDDFCNRIESEKAEVLRYHHNLIKNELSNKSEQYPLAIKSHLLLLLINLLREHNYRSDFDLKNSEAALDILAVYDYIDKHLSEKLTLEEISKVANLSPNYFCSVFKKLHSVSLWDYITARRIEKAVRLIKYNESLNMLDIALECGFNNTVNFNKAFKKHKGITPSELKNTNYLLPH
ncbi:MAG: helix-turn-helix transcriptional regulator [Clostridia bacterium]|nr:helix-turn-helix transcriptional regulator [Clostridia bacterium]